MHLSVPHPAAKTMFYCHDTYVLGHLRRTLALANHLRDRMPALSQLIVTGSPMAHGFQYPEGTDYIKLPSVCKNGVDSYEARSIASPIDDVRNMRGDILLSAACHFEPDVLIVDHAPAGLKGEAVPTLRYLKERSPGIEARRRLARHHRRTVPGTPVLAERGRLRTARRCVRPDPGLRRSRSLRTT